MGELVPFPSFRPVPSEASRRPPETVFQHGGWRVLEVPRAGKFLALSDYCRQGIVVGRFDPRADREDHHGGTEIALLTRCAADERLARCAIAWLNSGGPRNAILGAFVVAAGGCYRYWRDAIIEVAAIKGTRLARFVDGSIAIAREPEPVLLLDTFAALQENRRRAAFDRLPQETRAAILQWADPKRQFLGLLGRPSCG